MGGGGVSRRRAGEANREMLQSGALRMLYLQIPPRARVLVQREEAPTSRDPGKETEKDGQG